MTGIKEYIFTICFAAVAASLIQILIPNNTISKSMKTLVAVFFLCIIIMPFAKGFTLKNDLFTINKAPSEQINSLNNAVEDLVKKQAAQKIKDNINDVLRICNINNAKISILMDRNEDGSIKMSQIDIFLSKENMDRAKLVENEVKRQLGLDATVSEVKANE